MMERFTDYARSAMRTGFRRQPVATERDVVAAICRRGVAARLLQQAGVSASDLPAETVDQQALVERAVAAARGRGVDYVGTEHLLLAAAALPGSGLAARGASADRLGELLSADEVGWRFRPTMFGRVAAWCRSALRRA